MPRVPSPSRYNSARLAIDPKNRWRSLDARPYFRWPTWWRTFIFSVLSARDITVYAYIVSHVDKNGIAFPSIDNIREALDLKSVTMVKRSLRNLESTGFLLSDGVEKKAMRRQNVKMRYQRPRAHYTLICLLNKGLLDEQLRPVESSSYDPDDRADPNARAAIYSLLTLSYYRSLPSVYERFGDECKRKWPTKDGLKAKILCAFLSAVHECPELDPIQSEDDSIAKAKIKIQEYIEKYLHNVVPVPSYVWKPTMKKPKTRSVTKSAKSLSGSL